MENNYYGAPTSSEIKPLRERLREYYGESDFVTVINCDTKPIRYQFMRPESQTFIQNAPYHGETHNIKNPDVVVLQPGETKLCPAYEADLMIENLIKQITSARTEQRIQRGETTQAMASTNWSDPDVQSSLIKEIFQGKQDLVGSYNSQLKEPNEPKEPARVGRPRKEE